MWVLAQHYCRPRAKHESCIVELYGVVACCCMWQSSVGIAKAKPCQTLGRGSFCARPNLFLVVLDTEECSTRIRRSRTELGTQKANGTDCSNKLSRYQILADQWELYYAYRACHHMLYFDFIFFNCVHHACAHCTV